MAMESLGGGVWPLFLTFQEVVRHGDGEGQEEVLNDATLMVEKEEDYTYDKIISWARKSYVELALPWGARDTLVCAGVLAIHTNDTFPFRDHRFP
jgi:hypothetical protein